MKIRKGDQVQILSGKDRGKRGKVMRVIPKQGKIVVENLNLVKRHKRPRKSGEKGQRIEVPSPISLSKVMIVCTRCGKAVRIGQKKADGEKVRICKKCNSEI